MAIQKMEELFIHALSMMYDAEKQITVALPKMAGAATAPELKQAFLMHLEETKGQISRIEQAVKADGLQLHQQLCPVTAALIRDNEVTSKMVIAGPLLDAALIAGGRKVEHFETGCYLSLVEMAKQLGYSGAASLLQQTLDEEMSADEKLAAISEEAMPPHLAQPSASSMSASV